MRYLHTMVRVADLDASLHFYCDLLGLEEMRRMDNEAGRFTLVFLAAPADRASPPSRTCSIIVFKSPWPPFTKGELPKPD